MVGITKKMIEEKQKVKDIATKSTTNYILEKYDLYPKKKYGQNFLIDPHIVERLFVHQVWIKNVPLLKQDQELGL